MAGIKPPERKVSKIIGINKVEECDSDHDCKLEKGAIITLS